MSTHWTIYQWDDNDEVVRDEESEPIILDTIEHKDTWVYLFAWYVNTDTPRTPVSVLDGTTTAWVSISHDTEREVIEVPLDA